MQTESSTQRIEVPEGYREIEAKVGPLPEGGMWSFPEESKWYDWPPEIDEEDIESNIRVIVPISYPATDSHEPPTPPEGYVPWNGDRLPRVYKYWNKEDKQWEFGCRGHEKPQDTFYCVPASQGEPMKTYPSFVNPAEVELAEKVKRLEDENAGLRSELGIAAAKAVAYRDVIKMMLEARR